MRDDPVPALKAQLANELRVAIDGWETQELCYFLRTDQPRVSNLRNGRIERFSLEQLIRFRARMQVDVVITTRPAPRRSTSVDRGRRNP